jgi:hypothetical protein
LIYTACALPFAASVPAHEALLSLWAAWPSFGGSWPYPGCLLTDITHAGSLPSLHLLYLVNIGLNLLNFGLDLPFFLSVKKSG